MRRIKLKIFYLISVLIFLSTPHFTSTAPRWLNLYILDFDNLRSDPSIAWLSDGFVDILGQSFSKIDGVRVFGRKELEQLLQDRSRLLRQPTGTRNVLVMGNFVRDLDRISVTVQLLNIANWVQLGKVEAVGSLNQIAVLGKDLFTQLNSELRGQIPPQRRDLLQPPTARAEPPEYHQQAKEIRSSLSSAIEDLEESMDLYIGAREKVEGVGESHGKYYRDFSFGASGIVEEMPSEDIEMLEEILVTIAKNPYYAEIGKPVIEIQNRKDARVWLSVPVKYSLRENLIKDMLSSLPYTGMRQDGSVTLLEFSRRKFRVSDDLVERISQGKFRVIPVIQLLDGEGHIRSVILDSPDPYWHKQTSQNVNFTIEHVFSPLVVFSVSGWSLQVTMESVDINAIYKLKLPRKEVASYSRVQVEFIPETELLQFLSRIL